MIGYILVSPISSRVNCEILALVIGLYPVNGNDVPLILIAFTRGNEDLVNSDGDNIGNMNLYGGLMNNLKGRLYGEDLYVFNSNVNWGDDFKNYTLKWQNGNVLNLKIDDERSSSKLIITERKGNSMDESGNLDGEVSKFLNGLTIYFFNFIFV